MPNNFDRLFNQSQGDALINALKGIKSSLDVNYPLENINVNFSNTAQNITPSSNYYGIGQVNVPALNIIDQTILLNGQYDPVTSGYDGYGKLDVNVPNTYGASDEGKVVNNAALVAQTSRNITENGTYNTALNNEVVVNVEGGGGTVTKTVYTTVTGGYNGGAVIAITIDEEVVFTATAIDTYNRNYNITHDVIYISGSPVIIDITPPETTTSALGISIEGINTIQYSVMPDGANTSYGYNFSDSDPLTVGGGSSTLVEKTITENGTYDPADDNADGYSQVTVDVPSEYVDSPVNDYAFDYDPNNTATTVKSGGFLFTCKRACKVTKIRVYGVSTEAKVFISTVNGTTLASGTSNQVIVNQWNDVELDSPIDLFEDTEYVVWCSQNGVLLKYKNFFGSLYSDYILYKKGMYSQLADTFPSNAENSNAYAVDLYIDSIKIIKTAELITKQVTQNGTYNASDDNADGYSEVTVDISIEEWDFTDSLIGKLRGTVISNSGVVIDSSGATFDGTMDNLTVPIRLACCTIEISVGAMNLTSGTHRRFVMPTYNAGFIYRSNGKWSLYDGNNWATDSNITDGSYFANSTLKIVIDTSKYWHIYKDDVLVYEPDTSLGFSGGTFFIGSESNSINNVTITDLKIK